MSEDVSGSHTDSSGAHTSLPEGMGVKEQGYSNHPSVFITSVPSLSHGLIGFDIHIKQSVEQIHDTRRQN